MDQNIKYAIYFLLGIIIFYLMFNEKGVEGFDISNFESMPPFIYVKEGEDTIRLVKSNTTLEPLSGSNAKITEYNLKIESISRYYKHVEGEVTTLFIQKNSTDGTCRSCTVGEGEVAATTRTSGACRAAGGAADGDAAVACLATEATRDTCVANCIFTATGVITTPAADDVGTCIACTTEQVTAASAARTIDTCTAVVSSCTGSTLDACQEGCVFTPSVEYFLIKKTATDITSIHKIQGSVLDSLPAPVTIVGTTVSNSPLLEYSITSVNYVGLSAATTITIDTIPRCSTPTNASGQGYNVTETSLNLKIGADFNVSGTCATSYTGTRVVATTCSEDNASYTLSGCTPTPDPTVTPIPYTCNNGSAVVGSSSTSTQNCASCDDGYTKRSRICVQNASCSTFTGTCPEGKEKNEDNNCSGTCTSDVCCEDESNAMVIGIGVCGLILLILGGVAAVLMSNKSSAPESPQIRLSK